MRITIGFTLEYDDVGALTRLRNFLKPRVRWLYKPISRLLQMHYRALVLRNKYNINNGEFLILTFNIPPLLLGYWYSKLKYRILYKLGYRWCVDCGDTTHGKHGVWDYSFFYCRKCYRSMVEEYYNSYTPEEVEYYGG